MIRLQPKWNVFASLALCLSMAVCFLANSQAVYAQQRKVLPEKFRRPSRAKSRQSDKSESATQNQDQKKAAKATAFDGEAAFEYLKKVVAIGPRISATEGMKKQQEFLTEHFEELGGIVTRQPFKVRHPHLGTQVELANLIVRFHPERKNRILICCHYDTRPFPDRDPKNPQGIFLGANDGGSGVGLLCELGKHMPKLDGSFGIDFVFFDGEEFVFVNRRDPMFLGSTFFANEYRRGRLNTKYTFGILVDMVADAELEIRYERNSMDYAPRLTRSIWGVAQRIGVKEFIPKEKHRIRDDHLPLNQAGIPTCDIIDFDFPNAKSKNGYWHTEQDIVENCSADSLGKVGSVVLEWLREVQQLNR